MRNARRCAGNRLVSQLPISQLPEQSANGSSSLSPDQFPSVALPPSETTMFSELTVGSQMAH
ncbi:MAG: hypothetical protein ACI89X_003330 [Planctomycetota bacterium]|jgi:hypothetical protein